MKFKNTPHDIDRTDALLLQALQEDGKASLAQLGERVGLTPPAVMERVKKLERAGVITGYHAQLDSRSLGLDITAFIGVSIPDARRIEELEAWAEETPSVLECHHVTGGYTLMLKVKVANTRALEELINVLRSREGVSGTDTMVVFSTSVERVSLAIDVPEETPAARKRGRPRKKAS